jgi:hypothetical protein
LKSDVISLTIKDEMRAGMHGTPNETSVFRVHFSSWRNTVMDFVPERRKTHFWTHFEFFVLNFYLLLPRIFGSSPKSGRFSCNKVRTFLFGESTTKTKNYFLVQSPPNPKSEIRFW